MKAVDAIPGQWYCRGSDEILLCVSANTTERSTVFALLEPSELASLIHSQDAEITHLPDCTGWDFEVLQWVPATEDTPSGTPCRVRDHPSSDWFLRILLAVDFEEDSGHPFICYVAPERAKGSAKRKYVCFGWEYCEVLRSSQTPPQPPPPDKK